MVGLFERSEVPLRHQRAVDETDAKWTAARDKLINACGSGYLVALLGKRGPGKTQLAEQAIASASVLQRPSLYARAMTIFLELRATYRSETVTEADVIAKYRAPRLLVIDEMQERGETPWEDRMLNHLIDLRYGDMSDTLLVANQTPVQFKRSVGESIADRLRETGRIIECNWKSFRMDNQKASTDGAKPLKVVLE